MNQESLESRRSVVQRFIEIASAERRKVERDRPHLEGVAALTYRAKVTLESHARACLHTNTNLGGAVEMLALADALAKDDVGAMLEGQFNRLEQSPREEDQVALLDMCKRLVSATSGRLPSSAEREL